jgi:splicing factor U2AF subunit
MIVADNIGEHMIGNLYVKFAAEDQAESVLRAMTGKYYNQKPIHVEYSPVTDFREAKCR